MKLVSLLSLLLLSACQHNQVPDVPECLDFGSEGYCFFTVSKTEFTVDNDQNPWPYPDKEGRRYSWDEVKQKAFILPFDSQAAIATYILKECDKDKTCKAEASPKIQEKLKRVKQLMNLKLKK